MVTIRTIERLSPSDWRVEASTDYQVPLRIEDQLALSVSSTVLLNCPSRNLRVETVRYYREAGAIGEFARRDGSYRWGRPPQGTVEASIEGAICGGTPAQRQDGPAQGAGLPVPALGLVAPVLPTSTAPPAGSGAFEVQLFSASSQSIADAVRQRVRQQWADKAMKTVTVEQVVVNGVRFHRVLAGPFDRHSDAEAACRQIARLAPDCFARSRNGPR